MNISTTSRSSCNAVPAALTVSVALTLWWGVMGFAPTMASDEALFSTGSGSEASRFELPSGRALPFSIQDFAAFLGETFQMQPVESEPDRVKFIFAERQNDGRDVEIMRVVIQDRESHLQVAFSFKEFNVMHYVAEFIEGPFFSRTESEQLYALLYSHGGQRSWKPVGRFQARVTLIDGAEGIDALFEFAARSSGAGPR